jgi:hypothetical protein
MNEASVVLNGPVIVLCEGQHDAAFLHAVADRIGQANALDLPFFEHRNGRWQGRAGFAHGSGAIAGQLRAVALQQRASPNDETRIKCILLLRDCGDDDAAVRRETAAACREAGLPVPEVVGAWHDRENQPRTALLLLPFPQERGSLETLCLRHLRARHVAAAACLDRYFDCLGPPIPALTAENRSKAMLACLMAAIRPGNPTQTLSGAFSGTAPLIDVADSVFKPFADALCALLA